MKSFKVADFKAPLQEFDEATPQPSGTQVLIKVKAAGVCHSDLHIWEGGYDLGHGRKPLSLKDRGVSLPRTMGNETVGEVVAFGPDVTAADKGDLKIGDVAGTRCAVLRRPPLDDVRRGVVGLGLQVERDFSGGRGHLMFSSPKERLRARESAPRVSLDDEDRTLPM